MLVDDNDALDDSKAHISIASAASTRSTHRAAAAPLTTFTKREADAMRAQLQHTMNARTGALEALLLLEAGHNLHQASSLHSALEHATALHNAQRGFFASLDSVPVAERTLAPADFLINPRLLASVSDVSANSKSGAVLSNGTAVRASGDGVGGSGIDGGDLGGSDQKQADVGGAVGGLEARARADARILLHVAALQRSGVWNPRLPKAPEEPLRNKTHWDHLLEEMNWLSTDVSNERKWKIKMAKLLSRDVLQYFAQRASEERRRTREDEQRMKRVALLAARGVRRFWRQIEKLVDYKHQSVLDHRKKRSMSKQLDFLVGQTERYSTMLAQNLATSTKRKPVDDLGDDDDDDDADDKDNDVDDDDDNDSVSWSDLSFEAHPSTRLLIANDSDDAATSTMTAANASTTSTAVAGAADDDDEFVPDERRRKLPASKRATDGDGATAHESDDHEDDDGMLDDESTIAAAELAERNDPLLQLAPGERETDLLLREQTMPIEQLLAHYRTSKRRRVGSSGGGGGGGGADDDDDGDDDADDIDADGDASPIDKQEAADKARITAAASAASAVQPRGNTLAASDVRVAVPFLLRGQLREYQQVGLQWLATMCEKNLNGILADEMGLGKTIQTISLLAWLACERENWGPHLIVVPTSVMLNWEMEFRRWCPAFKIVTYYGSTKERKLLRRGWSRDNAFHVVITSYKLVTQDAPVFRRKKWQYFILDEAQNIKNYKSQRWQTLLNFNAAHRLLLTGTPLQNSLMELWSLMHFLMPDVFQSQSEFHEWFSNPLNAMVESGATAADVLGGGGGGDGPPDIIARLHSVLRPFLLRRLKADVEKQLPAKLHHVRYCSMSKRQRTLYEEFMARATTRATLDGGNFFGIVNVLMQLRKVCNHPDLFAPRPILSPFDMQPLQLRVPTQLLDVCEAPALPAPLRLLLAELESEHTAFAQRGASALDLPRRPSLLPLPSDDVLARTATELEQRRARWRSAVASSNAATNVERLLVAPIYGAATRDALCIASSRTDALLRHGETPVLVTELTAPAAGVVATVPHVPTTAAAAAGESAAIADTGVIARRLAASGALASLLESTSERIESARDVLDRCTMMVSRARTRGAELQCVGDSAVMERVEASIERADQRVEAALAPLAEALRPVYARRNVEFPDRRLVQFDCGKLQELADLLRELYSGGHRCLIFTQMTRMLDVLEEFLTLHGWVYVRLDGTTKLTERQALIERFNRDNRLFVFILSTRSGGFGLNLTGADTVIFYDSDWNPAMDAQAQDRCHRIGQTRDVHIYRLITRHTIEENILKKANQKRELDDLVIQGGQFTTEFFRDLDPRNLLSEDASAPSAATAAATAVAVAPRGRRGKVRAVAAPEAAAAPLTAEEARARQAEWEKAVAAAEDDTDAVALRDARRELRAYAAEYVDATQAGSSAAAEVAVATPGRVADEENLDEAPDEVIDEFASRLSAVQQYAVRFYEEIEPLRDYSGERAWHAERLRQAEATWAAASNAPANGAAAADDDSAATTASFRPKRARVTFQDDTEADHGEHGDDDTAATTTRAEEPMFYSMSGEKPVVQVNVVLEYCFAPPDPRIDEGRTTAPRDYLADCLFGNKMFSVDLLGGFGVEAARQYRAGKRHAKAAQAAAKSDHPLRIKVPNPTAVRGDAPPSEAQLKATKAAEKAERKADKEQRRLLKEREEMAERDRALLAAVTVPWHASEDAALARAVAEFGQAWELVASVVSALPSGRRRSALQCLHRYKKLVDDASGGTAGAAAQKRRANQPPAAAPLYQPMQPTLPLPRSIAEQQRNEARMLTGLARRFPLPRHIEMPAIVPPPTSLTLVRVVQMAFADAASAAHATPADVAAAAARYAGAAEVFERSRVEAAREAEAARQRDLEAARQREMERQQAELARRQQVQLMQQHALAQQRGVAMVQTSNNGSNNATAQPWLQSHVIASVPSATQQRPVVTAAAAAAAGTQLQPRWLPQNIVQPVPSGAPLLHQPVPPPTALHQPVPSQAHLLHPPVPRRQDARPINFSLFAPPANAQLVAPPPPPPPQQPQAPLRFAQAPPTLAVPPPPRTVVTAPTSAAAPVVAATPPPPPPPPPPGQQPPKPRLVFTVRKPQ